MTFPDLKGDPMTTDTPTNRHDEMVESRERVERQRLIDRFTNIISEALPPHWYGTARTAAEDCADLALTVLASSLHAGLPTPPEADHRDSGATWWTIKPANWQYPSQVVARHGGPVFINHEHFTPAEARLLAAILLAAADVAEGGTR